MRLIIFLSFILASTFCSFSQEDLSQYDTTKHYKGGVYLVGKDGKYGYLNDQKKLIIPLVYDKAQYTGTGWLVVVKQNGYEGCLDVSKRELIIPCKYDKVFTRISQNRIGVRSSGVDMGFFDTNGNQITEFVYDHLTYFKSGYSRVRRNNLYGLIDTTGTVVLDISYKDKSFDELLEIYRDKQADLRGPRYVKSVDYKWVGPPNKANYQTVKMISSGYFAVIDKSKKILIELKEDVEEIVGIGPKHFLVKKEELYALINSRGKVLLLPQIRSYEFDHFGNVIVENSEGDAGVIDQEGNIVVPIAAKAESIKPFSNEFYIAKANHSSSIAAPYYGIFCKDRERSTGFIFKYCSRASFNAISVSHPQKVRIIGDEKAVFMIENERSNPWDMVFRKTYKNLRETIELKGGSEYYYQIFLWNDTPYAFDCFKFSSYLSPFDLDHGDYKNEQIKLEIGENKPNEFHFQNGAESMTIFERLEDSNPEVAKRAGRVYRISEILGRSLQVSYSNVTEETIDFKRQYAVKN